MELERCIVCLDSEPSLVVTNCCGQLIYFACLKESLESSLSSTCPYCRVYSCCGPKFLSNKQEYQTLYEALGTPLIYRLSRVYGRMGFVFYHQHYDLLVEDVIVLGKSQDWIEKEKQEKEQEKRAAAERERRAEETYVITLRFADTLERGEE